jgi:secondary thiamine-phosphate synthase enzyme
LEIRLTTAGNGDIQNLTPSIEACIQRLGFQNGLLTVIVVGSTAAITTMEYEPGLKEDIPRVLERLVPRNDVYQHELTWNDNNGHSHVCAALLGPSLSVPVVEGKMTLGTWQQVVLIELDTRSRDRQIVVQAMGESTI